MFQLLKNAIGIPQSQFLPYGGVSLSDSIVRFMRSVGIEVIMGYGLSETTATVSLLSRRGIRYRAQRGAHSPA